MMRLTQTDRHCRLVVSYSHIDLGWVRQLYKHLAWLREQGLIKIFCDRETRVGDDWSQKFDEEIERADLVMLMVSPDYMASQYCREEMEQAMELSRVRRVRVLPVLVRRADWSGAPFSPLQKLPRDEVPIAQQSDSDAAWFEIVTEVRTIVENLRAFAPTKADIAVSPQADQSEASSSTWNDEDSESRQIPATLALGESLESLGSPEAGAYLSNRGMQLWEAGVLRASEKYFAEALRVTEVVLGSHSALVSVRLNQLAAVQREQGKLKPAREHAERALALSEALDGMDHPTVACRLTNLALILRAEGEGQLAEVRLRKAHEILRARKYRKHEFLGTVLSNLALVCRDRNDLFAARRYLRQALAADRRAYGRCHVAVAVDLNSLGLVYSALGKPGAARRYWQQAQGIFSEVNGPEHSYCRMVESNLAGMLATSSG